MHSKKQPTDYKEEFEFFWIYEIGLGSESNILGRGKDKCCAFMTNVFGSYYLLFLNSNNGNWLRASTLGMSNRTFVSVVYTMLKISEII